VPRQAELELVQERTMGGTPEPIIADFVEALGQHMLQKAPDEGLTGGKLRRDLTRGAYTSSLFPFFILALVVHLKNHLQSSLW
jgi:hypothetical protein